MAEYKTKHHEYIANYSREHYYSLQVKMKFEDAQLIRDAAKDAGMTTSAFIRMCVKEHLDK